MEERGVGTVAVAARAAGVVTGAATGVAGGWEGVKVGEEALTLA